MADLSNSSLSEDRPVRRRSAEKAERSPSALLPPRHPLLRLQRAAGNAAVARMVLRQADDTIRRESEGGEGEEEEMMAKHDPAIQRESEGGEGEEEEMMAKHDPAIQRESEGGEGEEEEMMAKHDSAIQRAEEQQIGLEGGAVGAGLQSRIDSKRGSGSTLSPSMQTSMESAMGTSFADVRVHRDAESDSLNRSITAKAFTTGNDIFLRGDQNDNDSHLMAHELHHVTQQRSMSSSGGGMTVGAADDAHEHEADAVSAAVNSGQTAQRHSEDER